MSAINDFDVYEEIKKQEISNEEKRKHLVICEDRLNKLKEIVALKEGQKTTATRISNLMKEVGYVKSSLPTVAVEVDCKCVEDDVAVAVEDDVAVAVEVDSRVGGGAVCVDSCVVLGLVVKEKVSSDEKLRDVPNEEELWDKQMKVLENKLIILIEECDMEQSCAEIPQEVSGISSCRSRFKCRWYGMRRFRCSTTFSSKINSVS